MDQDAKSHLSKTIRSLRGRLIDDLADATRRRYRLQVRPRDAGLNDERAAARKRLEDYLAEQQRAEEQRGGDRDQDDFLDEVVKEAAYTWLNRLVLLRLMEEAELVRPPVVDGGWNSKAYREFREWAPELMDDETGGYRLLLDIVFDELAHDLPGLYGDVGLTELVPMPPATLRATIEDLNEEELQPCWSDDTTLGWVYQYWNDPEREKLDDKLNSGGKIEPHEVASKTQLFTERYMVEWLLHNSLGQMWLTICEKNGWTPEVEQHGVLDELEERRAEWRKKRDNGEVELDELMPIKSDVEDRWKYWVPQPLPDEAVETAPDSVWDIQLLDPACGSGHFLVIAFDLLVPLYEEEARHRGEEWDTEEVLDNVFETNLNGIDIDRRAVQIAAAALYLKARTVEEGYCPPILNLVAPDISLANLAEDDPALVELREAVEAETGIPPKFVDRILDALGEAHHLGSLLKIDDEVEAAMEVLEPDEQPDLFTGARIASPQGSTDRKPNTTKTAPETLPPVGEVAEATAEADGDTGEPPRPQSQSLSESSDARRALIDLLEGFLADHSRSEDLGLRLRGEQLANGIRFVRLNREGQYDLVVANPPYLGYRHLKKKTKLKDWYAYGSSDLFSCFAERGLQFAEHGGNTAMVTMRNWMFLKTYENFRRKMLNKNHVAVLGDFDRGAFEGILDEVVAVVLPIFCKGIEGGESIAMQPTPLEDSSRDIGRTARKRSAVLCHFGRYEFDPALLNQIDRQPIVYWWDEEFLKRYNKYPTVGETEPGRKGLCTGNNTRFHRRPWEICRKNLYVRLANKGPVDRREAAFQPWVPTIEGAGSREWFEPLHLVLKWAISGIEYETYRAVSNGVVIRNPDYYFQPGVAFSMIGDDFSARAHRFVSVFGNMGSSVFSDDIGLTTCLFNSRYARFVLESLNPGMHFEVGDVNRLPLFPIESADEIFEKLDEAFTEHEQARETSVEFKKPGPSCWEYAQDWAQTAVDRDEGEPLPEWGPDYDEPPPENWLSWSIGVALGRFDEAGQQGWLDEAPDDALPHGIFFVTATDGEDSLDHPATDIIEAMWDKYGDDLGKKRRKRDDLNSWIREAFFRKVHRQMYDNAPIYFPLTSADKNFTAHINIHRWDEHTLRRLLADYLVPEKNRLEGRLADLTQARSSDDDTTRRRAEDRYSEVKEWLEELTQFIDDVEQCAEKGPPPTDSDCPERETDARYVMDLDDGTMINAAGLWPLLEPNWRKYPKKWWKRLANEKGYRGKHFDWSKLAARYFPTRVDEKCQKDPSLAVAHGCFWKYHPARAYAWELRLQDEIHPNFTIDEANSDEYRQAFFDENPENVEEIRQDEIKRRQRNAEEDEEILPVPLPEDHPTSQDEIWTGNDLRSDVREFRELIYGLFFRFNSEQQLRDRTNTEPDKIRQLLAVGERIGFVEAEQPALTDKGEKFASGFDIQTDSFRESVLEQSFSDSPDPTFTGLLNRLRQAARENIHEEVLWSEQQRERYQQTEVRAGETTAPRRARSGDTVVIPGDDKLVIPDAHKARALERLIEAVALGTSDKEQLAWYLDVDTTRTVDRYLRLCRQVDLVRSDKIDLTDRGRAYAFAGDQRHAHLRQAFEDWEVVQAIIDELPRAGYEPVRAARTVIEARTSLTGDTVAKRARGLANWLTKELGLLQLELPME